MKTTFFKGELTVPKLPVKSFKNRRKLKRDEYRLRFKDIGSYFKIPYLRFRPDPFSIAFLILVIISSDVWPHTKFVSGTPVLRHRKLLTNVNPNYSKSESVYTQNVNSGAKFLNQPQPFLKRHSRSFSKTSPGTSSLISTCSHVGDETNEISARAFMAETIFEGKVRSKSSVRDPGVKYGVTFVVQHVHKDQSNGQNALRSRTQVRLYFKQKLSSTKPTAHCVQRYNYTRRPGDLTKANIKRGRRYIVFVNGIGPHNYTILGEPVPKTKKNVQAVKDVLCRNCVRQIGVWGLKNESIDINKTLHLVCRIKGNPLPALQWFKDGSPIIVNSRLRIQYKKRRSLLVIPEVRNSDAGKYECRGFGVQSLNPVSSWANVNINTRYNNTTDLSLMQGQPCPMEWEYCLNGGICTHWPTIGDFNCQCADGFNGARCESKDVMNSNSTYDPITCFDGVTPSYPCVTVHKPLNLDLF